MIEFNTFTKIAKNVGDLGKLILAKCFKKWPKVQEIAQSGHTGYGTATGAKDPGLQKSRVRIQSNIE